MSTSQLSSGSRPTRIRQHLTVLLTSVLALVGVGLIRFAANAGVAGVARQQSNIEAAIDEYMVAMASGDVQRAYALFSPRAKRQMTVTDIEQLMRGDAYMAFQGYQSVIVESLLVRTVIDTNSNSPQGIVAQITGAIRYEDGTEGSLAAVLERNASQWRLFNIRVTPSSKRIQRSPQAMGNDSISNVKVRLRLNTNTQRDLLAYDTENRLTSITGSGVNAPYVYDGDGKLVKATVGGVTTVYIGNIYERDNGATVRKYYYAGAVRVAMRVGVNVNYLLNDHLTSTAITTNSSGVRLTELRYNAYPAPTSSPAPDAAICNLQPATLPPPPPSPKVSSPPPARRRSRTG